MVKNNYEETYIKKVKENHPDFEVRGRYVKSNVNITMYHKKCGREFEIRPANFLFRGTCSLCNGKFRKTTKEFKKEVYSLVGSEYKLLSEYVNAKSKVLFKHNKCGREWSTTPDDFLNGGSRCRYCWGSYKNHEMFVEEVKDLVGSEYTILGKYVNKLTDITFKHNSCGKVFKKSPEVFLRGMRCPDCGLEARSGKNHWKYNPNLTDKERQKRDMFNGEIRKWRDKVYERDDYTCRVCSSKGGKLNAHHLNSWDEHEHDRFNLNNGTTLCETCHKNFHMLFGYGNNTAKQFRYYLTNSKNNNQLTLF